MDAEQELFTALKLGIEAKGYAVYDHCLFGRVERKTRQRFRERTLGELQRVS